MSFRRGPRGPPASRSTPSTRSRTAVAVPVLVVGLVTGLTALFTVLGGAAAGLTRDA
ncbi:hypothetical protein [Streptomyces olivaceus]|uniref:hypothetical protein n=1 Tax=Streptomyces olivaceus TaxID=47716 RepID=UPI001CCBCB86|nr:hypothetical protein [Streptomyces olivaceus]MBZ6141745.1 hypothetical protein [Streptomyces olivaceus]MBZ6169587.1 hypothetical protein [Streptomyces olivaceus]